MRRIRMALMAICMLACGSVFASGELNNMKMATAKCEVSMQNAKTQLRSDVRKANVAMQEVCADDFAFNSLTLSGNYVVCTFNFIDFGYIDQSDADEFALNIFSEFSAARRMVQNAYKAGYGLKVVVKTYRGSRTYTYGNKVFLKM